MVPQIANKSSFFYLQCWCAGSQGCRNPSDKPVMTSDPIHQAYSLFSPSLCSYIFKATNSLLSHSNICLLFQCLGG